MTYQKHLFQAVPVRVGCLLFLTTLSSWAQLFTVQVGPPPPPTITLVQSGDTWHYRKGTNEPPADWHSVDDADLDASWLTGPGGFGYGDNDDATVLGDMRMVAGSQPGYLTVYIRKSFEISSPVDPNSLLHLVINYDDGFIAYLDGVEMTRSSNVPGNPGDIHPYNQDLANVAHEASGAEVFDLGLAASLLDPGTHVLAIQCINDDIASSDLSLIADLTVVPNTPNAPVNGEFLSVVQENPILLSGVNAVPNSTEVLVNGVAASLDTETGAWMIDQPLQAGANQIIIDVVNDQGMPLLTTNKLIIYEVTSTIAGGTLTSNTTWDDTTGVVHVTSNVTVPSGIVLSIRPGAVVLLDAGRSIVAEADGAILATGTAESTALFGPSDGTTVWGELAADGEDARLTLQHVETIAGAAKIRNGALGLLEDSYFHHYKSGSTPIAGCTRALHVTVRRCHFNVYHETLWQITPIVVEDSLFENANNPSSDALDFDTAPPGSVIRRCTFRNGPEDNTDAIDLGSQAQQVLVEDCLMANFPNDKAISIGEDSFDIVIRNCLMYGCDSGVAVKDSCTAIIYGNTIADCDYGFRCYNKANPASSTGGGHITDSYDNILWNFSSATLSLLNASTMVATYSDIQGTNYPGAGNVDVDPGFQNSLEHDYRLASDSPLRGAGRDGGNMGARFPVGAPMAPSHPYLDSINVQGDQVELEFIADHERSYTVEYSDDVAGGEWTKLKDVWPRPWPVRTKISDSLAGHPSRFYRLVSPARM